MPFRDEQVIVIEVGSSEHRATCGLAESLAAPRLRISSTVAYDAETETYACGEDIAEVSGGDAAPLLVDTIRGGEVQDWTALVALWSHILSSLSVNVAESATKSSASAVLLVIPPQWGRSDRERATRIFFELFKVAAFMTLHAASAALYASNASTGIVIDVGHDKTDVSAIVDTLVQSTITLPTGGRHLTETLVENWRIEPPLDETTQQPVRLDPVDDFALAEAVKRSNITELILPQGGKSSAVFDFQSADNTLEENEGVLDIAAVVTKGNTKEYLAKLAADKLQQSAQRNASTPNNQRQRNTFVRAGGSSISVGPERLAVGSAFVAGALADAIYDCVHAPSVDTARRRELWESMVLVGNGSKVRGFREALQTCLASKYTALNPPPVLEPGAHFFNVAPYPTTVRFIRIPPHFSEWQTKDGALALAPAQTDKGCLEEAAFLGGQIVARVAFGDTHVSVSRHYVGRSDYNEVGPTAIHA